MTTICPTCGQPVARDNRITEGDWVKVIENSTGGHEVGTVGVVTNARVPGSEILVEAIFWKPGHYGHKRTYEFVHPASDLQRLN